MEVDGKTPKIQILISWALWKINLWREYKKYGFKNWSINSIFRELFDSRVRTSNYRDFKVFKDRLAFEVAKDTYGIDFVENTSANALIEVFLDNAYDKLEEYIPSASDTVVDVGAQGGDYTLLAGKYYGSQVYAFEPMKSNFETLSNNIERNGQKGISLFNIALGAHSSKTRLNFDGDMITSSETGNGELVSMERLDSFNLKPSILKIDVEGFELDVLEGARETIKKYKPRIILEVHSKLLKEQCTEYLSSLGYYIFKEDRKILGKQKNLVQNMFFLPS